MTLVGVSTSVLARKADLRPLLDLNPEIVEWYAMRSSMLGEMERFGAGGVRHALHAPMPFDELRPPRFAPTSVDPELARAALQMLRRTLDCARSLQALYVVIHFPDPDPPYESRGFRDRTARFLEEVVELSSRSNVEVLLENMTPNPLLRSPGDYRSILSQYPTLGLCLDLGHAHLTQPLHTLDEYIDELADRVRVVHLYNTTPARYERYGHEPIREGQEVREGYFDWQGALLRVLESTNVRALIVEHDGRFGTPAARRAMSKLRTLIRSDGASAAADAGAF